MTVCRSVREARTFLEGRTDVGLVPTMGAFHAGHLELMRRSLAESAATVVSLFVNPLQFGPNEDFDRYPRPVEQDLAMAQKVGVDMVFAPSPTEMTQGSTTVVDVGKVSHDWEGASRPGHFAGVATIVLKLFEVVQPARAYFGLKDLQQCAVVRKMVDDLFLPVVIRTVEVQREESGLARSSRNQYLSNNDRQKASFLFRSLSAAAETISQGGTVEPSLESCKDELMKLGFDVDYVALVDPLTLRPLDAAQADSRVMAAASFGGVRLIDNVPILPTPIEHCNYDMAPS